MLSASAIVIMSWQDVTRSSLCSGVKDCGIKRDTTFSFPNSLSEMNNYILGDVQRFCCHSWCDSTVIFDQISNSSNVYLISSRFWKGYYSLHIIPVPFRLEIQNTTWKLFIVSEPHSNMPFAPTLVFLSQIDWFWKKILWKLSVHFLHPWHIRKTDFTRQVITRRLLKINKRNSVRERMMVDST
jgi:hypothetical protein